MKICQVIFSVLALAISGFAWADPIPETQESTMGFKSFDLSAEQRGSFEVSFDATPLADNIDGFTGISATTPSKAADVAAIVRFNETGTIDVRNGGSFGADHNLGYSANQVYRVRMVIDVASKRYSVFVTAPGQSEVALAKNYAFRSTQADVQALKKIVLAGYKGRHRIAGVSLKATAAP